MQPLQSSEGRCIATGQYAVCNIQGCPLQCLSPSRQVDFARKSVQCQMLLSDRLSSCLSFWHFILLNFLFLSKFSVYCKYELIKSELKGLHKNSIASDSEIFMLHQGEVL